MGEPLSTTSIQIPLAERQPFQRIEPKQILHSPLFTPTPVWKLDTPNPSLARPDIQDALRKEGAVVETDNVYTHYVTDTKDPSFGGGYVYYSAGSSGPEIWRIGYATMENGGWVEKGLLTLDAPPEAGMENPNHVAAPGVITDESGVNMFLQTEFTKANGKINHFVSQDSVHFSFKNICIQGESLGPERSSMYDPHPFVVTKQDGTKEYYLTFAAGPKEGAPPVKGDIMLAKRNLSDMPDTTNPWVGAWKVLPQPILSHEEVPHHNQKTDAYYEWGLEGPQIIPLPSGKFLLVFVAFSPSVDGQDWGQRQHVSFALSEKVTGPYTSLGAVIQKTKGENGHASGFVQGNDIILFFQERNEASNNRWRIGMATYGVDDIEQVFSQAHSQAA